MKQTQLIKGVLEGCVLAIIADHEIYGYELIQALRAAGFDSIVGGTLYPLLVKLEKHGALTSQFKASPAGPQRKYYAITPQGLQTLATFNLQWFQLKEHVDHILTRRSHHE
ncbi:PadR family transcriptional regulator [Lactiplantibacillus paraplantarum]|uniref:PadR family transcriptional regulator n=1 Tax=Lactiplantibacillus paraplantarum TaxID=60520 RepID=UPI000512D193|nr:PadR family transcriptional regulator [Lactiplantibacillus paraplantarum]OAX74864.1 PadR family transcriptional regulator [Lactiplantibacillus plantarum]ALO05114.1 PadR family transcriptional regulator [Lactiplantibacillus paraplantarum]KGE75946.1 PadR family transcriptional regulator [Lactiplantibacillus paraplantarum]MCW1911327.1 PadR family transcriptional regulator [Lactiplantibacillus paraplantarum]RDG09815.1 PadR family transcriptional regulator [Lactiplantibacillus paraplantarum]